jgi:large subunit ribosomal protein L10
MPNLVNELLIHELEQDLENMGSCLVVGFDKFTVADAEAIRSQFRAAGMRMRVVKNRLAHHVFAKRGVKMDGGFAGKSGIVIAPEEGAIAAAKIIGEVLRLKKKAKQPTSLTITGAVIEGHAYVGAAAEAVADMPDKNTVRAQLAGAIAGVARGLATCIQAAGPGNVARALQARCDKAAGDAGAQ